MGLALVLGVALSCIVCIHRADAEGAPLLVQSPLPGETYAPDQRVFVALHVSSSFVPQKPFIEIAVDGAGATKARLKANAPHQRHTSAAEEVCAADESDVPLLGFYSQLPPLAEGSHTVTLGLAGLAEPVTIGFHVGSASYAHTVNASRSRSTRFPPFSTDECISRSAKGACCALTNVCLVACGESSSGTAGGAAMPCTTGDSFALAYFQSPLVPPFRGEALSVASAHTRIRGVRLLPSSYALPHEPVWIDEPALIFDQADAADSASAIASEVLPLFAALHAHKIDTTGAAPLLLSLHPAAVQHAEALSLLLPAGSARAQLASEFLRGRGAGGRAPVCFSTAVVGRGNLQNTAPSALYAHWSDGTLWWRLRHHVLRTLHIDGAPPVPPACRIVLSFAATLGPRSVENAREVGAALAANPQLKACAVLSVDAATTLSTQVSLVASASVLVAQTGAPAALAPFLPYGSVLVEVGMHMGNRSAYFVADHVLASIDYIQAMFYEPSEGEVAVTDYNRHISVGDSAPLKLKVARLGRSIKRALAWVRDFHAVAMPSTHAYTEHFRFNRPGYAKCCTMKARAAKVAGAASELRSSADPLACYNTCWKEVE